MRKFKTGILIRNKRLEKMQDLGIKVNYSILNDEDYIQELKAKIIEEANEVATAESKQELTAELADVLEVIEHIRKVYDISEQELAEFKAKKQAKIGSFDKRIKTHYLEISQNNKNALEYYLAHPEKYPEITN